MMRVARDALERRCTGCATRDSFDVLGRLFRARLRRSGYRRGRRMRRRMRWRKGCRSVACSCPELQSIVPLARLVGFACANIAVRRLCFANVYPDLLFSAPSAPAKYIPESPCPCPGAHAPSNPLQGPCGPGRRTSVRHCEPAP